MGELIDKNKYLDFNGLSRYDELIKSYIVLGDESLTSAYKTADENLEISIKGYIDEKVDLKQNVIEDLESIRSGAAAGATALQTVPSEYITETELTDKKYATTSQVETLIDTVTASDSDIDGIFDM
ncbi:MAG: hypothetical protein J6V44_05240 [Methanobrevibacter sp.]|nr:hypothetical protein [Methanobrevibacter sp.]